MCEAQSFCRVDMDTRQSCSIVEPGLILPETEAVQVEIFSVPSVDPRQLEMQEQIEHVDALIASMDSRITNLDREIDILTDHSDKADIAVAVISGTLSGMIDSLCVGEFSLDRARTFGVDKINELVQKIASRQKGEEFDDLAKAVQYLEANNNMAADAVTASFGGGKLHHLMDFSHHPTPIGLLFSIITQFTGAVYGTDLTGAFKVVPLPDPNSALIGSTFPEKIMFGTIRWFLHLVSDLAGASGSIMQGSEGTGLPGPFLAMLKEVSSLPIFQKTDESGRRELSNWIAKIFDGTLVDGVKFDLRTELGVAYEGGKQALPVILNESIVRGFFFIRRLVAELKSKKIKRIKDLRKIDWKRTLPFKNRTIARMLTVSTGVATAIDLCDAAVRSGGQLPLFLVRVNFVGLGRFVFALGSDVVMQVRKSAKEDERLELLSRRLQLFNAKVSYRQASMWIEAEHLAEAMDQVALAMDQASRECLSEWRSTSEDLQCSVEICHDLRQKRADRNSSAASLMEEFADILC